MLLAELILLAVETCIALLESPHERTSHRQLGSLVLKAPLHLLLHFELGLGDLGSDKVVRTCLILCNHFCSQLLTLLHLLHRFLIFRLVKFEFFLELFLLLFLLLYASF